MAINSHRCRLFTCYLVLLFLWQTPILSLLLPNHLGSTTYAQNLTTPTLGEASTTNITNGSATLDQWKSLQVAAAQELLKKEETTAYFKTNFNIDGAYGEMQDGKIVADWEALAKTMGTTGLALAGAYAVWRRRRLDYLNRLRSGDGAAIEDLFEENFGPEVPGSISATTTPLPSQTPPADNTTWEAWGNTRGVPAAGATLAALYALWLKKKELTTTDQKDSYAGWSKYFGAHYAPQSNQNYQAFYSQVNSAVSAETKQEEQKIINNFNENNPLPAAPIDDGSFKEYESLDISNTQLFEYQTAFYKKAQAAGLSTPQRAEIVKEGLQKMWQHYYYALFNQKSTYILSRQIGYATLYAANFTAQSTQAIEQAARNKGIQGYSTLKSKYNQKEAYNKAIKQRDVLLSQSLNTLKTEKATWTKNISAWWTQAQTKTLTTKNWLSQLTNLSAQSAKFLQTKKQTQQEKFKNNLALLTASFEGEDLSKLISRTLINNKTTKQTTNLSQLEQTTKNIQSERDNQQNRLAFNDKAYAAQGVTKDSRGTYRKWVYNSRYQRWEHQKFNTAYLDNAKISTDYNKLYADKLFNAQQAIEEFKSTQFKNLLIRNSQKSLLDKLETLNSKKTLEEIFPPVKKPTALLNIEKQINTLNTQKNNALQQAQTLYKQRTAWIDAQDTHSGFLRTVRNPYRWTWTEYFAYKARLQNYRQPYKKMLEADKKSIGVQFANISQVQAKLEKKQRAFSQAQTTRNREISEYQELKKQAPELNQVKQFLETLSKFPDHPYTQDARTTLEQISTWKTQLVQAQQDLQFKNLSYGPKHSAKAKVKSLEEQINDALEKLVQYQEFFTADPDAQASKSDIGADVSLLFHRDQYYGDNVHKFVEFQTKSKEFYKKYGQPIQVLENLKRSLSSQIEAQKHLEGKSLYSHGNAYRDYVALKTDYQKVLNGQMPDVYLHDWNWYNSGSRTYRSTAVPNPGDPTLQTLYHTKLTAYNTYGIQEKMEAREAELFAERKKSWEENMAVALEDKFSAEQIARYQEIKQSFDNANQKYAALSQAEAAVARVKEEAIKKNNQAQTTNTSYKTVTRYKNVNQSDLLILDPNSVTPISFQVASSAQILGNKKHLVSDRFQLAFTQSIKLYEADYNKYYAETSRLMDQAKSNRERELIKVQNLPPKPVITADINLYESTQAAVDKYQPLVGGLEKDKRLQEQRVNSLKAQIDSQKDTSYQYYLDYGYSDSRYLNIEASIRAKQKQLQAMQTALDEMRLNWQTSKNELDKNLPFLQQRRTAYEKYQTAKAHWDRVNNTDNIKQQVANEFNQWNQQAALFWQIAHETVKVAQINQGKGASFVALSSVSTEEVVDRNAGVELAEKSPFDFSSENPNAEKFFQQLTTQKSESANSVFAFTSQAVASAKALFTQGQSAVLRNTGLTWDVATNTQIKTLHPLIRDKASAFVNAVQDQLGVTLRINSAYRNNTQQAALYAQGRTTPGNIVTNANAGESYHNYGLAMDISAIKDGKHSYNLDWEAISTIAKNLGFSWGGDWKNLADKPHFQMDFGLSTTQLAQKTQKNGFVDFAEKGMTQVQAEKFVGFSEEYFQAWATHQPGPVKEEVLREEFIKKELGNIPLISLKAYTQFNKDLSGLSERAKNEVKKVHKDVVQYLQDDALGQSNQAAQYIKRIRNADLGTFTHDIAAYFAADAYTNENPQILGFDRIIGKYGVGFGDLNHSESGFKASMYENDDTVVISFAGTEDFTDWETNIGNAAGKITEQYNRAINLAETLQRKSGKKVILTGHSLGGGLAAAAGAKTGLETITFNAAGNNPFVLKKVDVEFTTSETIHAFTDFGLPDFVMDYFEKDFPNITNHVTRGDLLTEAQESLPFLSTAIGKQVEHGSYMQNWTGLVISSRNPIGVISGIAGGTVYHSQY